MDDVTGDRFPTCTKYTVTFATSNTMRCAWCGVDLSLASNIVYLNGNKPCCDLCLIRGKKP